MSYFLMQLNCFICVEKLKMLFSATAVFCLCNALSCGSYSLLQFATVMKTDTDSGAPTGADAAHVEQCESAHITSTDWASALGQGPKDVSLYSCNCSS